MHYGSYRAGIHCKSDCTHTLRELEYITRVDIHYKSDCTHTLRELEYITRVDIHYKSDCTHTSRELEYITRVDIHYKSDCTHTSVRVHYKNRQTLQEWLYAYIIGVRRVQEQAYTRIVQLHHMHQWVFITTWVRTHYTATCNSEHTPQKADITRALTRVDAHSWLTSTCAFVRMGGHSWE